MSKSEIDDSDYAQTKIRLLLFEDKKTGKIKYGAYMSIENFAGTFNGEVHYKDAAGFTGKIIFYTLNGTFSNG